MKKGIHLLLILTIVGLGVISCKSKQSVVIPGAHVEATNEPVEQIETITVTSVEAIPEKPSSPATKPAATPAPAVTPAPTPTPVYQPEEVRDEKFKLDEEEDNADIINLKYHVVVGSFKNRDNAKGLQNTLNAEGNNAVIVVNEHGMYRVLIASFKTYQEARAKINQISNRFPDAWVLTQKQ